MWSILSTNKKQLARESFPALSACSCDCFEFLLVPLDCMPLLWVTWLTRIVYLYSFWFYDAQLKTKTLMPSWKPIGRYFDLPWRDRSRSFVMRPFCDFSNKLSKLHDSSKLKFCCLQKLAQKAVYLLIVNWACSQTLYLLFRDRAVCIALFIFSRVLRSFSHARFTRTLDKKPCTDRLCRLEPLLSYPHKSSTQRIRTEKASHLRISTWTQLKMKN